MKGGTEEGGRKEERDGEWRRERFHVHAHLCTFGQFLVVCFNSVCDINTLILTN